MKTRNPILHKLRRRIMVRFAVAERREAVAGAMMRWASAAQQEHRGYGLAEALAELDFLDAELSEAETLKTKKLKAERRKRK